MFTLSEAPSADLTDTVAAFLHEALGDTVSDCYFADLVDDVVAALSALPAPEAA